MSSKQYSAERIAIAEEEQRQFLLPFSRRPIDMGLDPFIDEHDSSLIIRVAGVMDLRMDSSPIHPNKKIIRIIDETRITHHPILPQFTLPYLVGHSKLGHSDWFQWTLIRSVCCCSLIEDFRRERIYLELSYLTNGYSLLFVETHIQHFFEYFHTPHLQYINNQTQYNEFRLKWLDYIGMQYELTDQLQQCENQGRLIRLHYLYEWGPRCNFNQKFLELWSEYFRRHPLLSTEKLKILLTTKHEYSLNTLLGGLD
ncbi:unnamed protein product [Adineta steineri]|uniref:Uncharacterized protein n=1 Tax=Adineta steineri TaxID=433720 RepID=A0A816CX15_9BILA|nr:unnamed protein product [Adineta steineri]CAF1630739.1 unnamed protein product [Adineta steineri]